MNESETVLLRDALPDLLITQLLASEVYATFLKCASEQEREMWREMLAGELSNIRFLAMLIEEESIPSLQLPQVKLDPFRELCARACEYAPQSAFERTLWALRLEHAEIDFGLEALAASVVGHAPETPVYPGHVQEQYGKLLAWAARYKGAREIAIQIARIEEHLPRLSDPETHPTP